MAVAKVRVEAMEIYYRVKERVLQHVTEEEAMSLLELTPENLERSLKDGRLGLRHADAYRILWQANPKATTCMYVSGTNVYLHYHERKRPWCEDCKGM